MGRSTQRSGKGFLYLHWHGWEQNVPLQSLALPWHAGLLCTVNLLLCHFCGFWQSSEVCCFLLGKNGTSYCCFGLYAVLDVDADCVFRGISFKSVYSFFCPSDPQKSWTLGTCAM